MPYIPLKQRITIVRNRTEQLFSTKQLERSLAASQRLDRLIFHVLQIRNGRFCCNAGCPKRRMLTARREHRMRTRAQVAS